ncbi:tetratricopeptide repeat protein [Mucilaginibacter ginsenosidivorans]|uniref:Tetratricopeptide repeat protein n=1 Tax=Mucilaginibacter ginsenosidivorans TaxID=398053 RepID=A0A5B8URC4_9SPHI|nr:tetratricopeptide repeat protein [Mucilaginibacter ginsenosidivorans]QEC61442.1 tetratricopeptide repeat protein [Mucilaginibacter ginsenosidivorans]
MKSFFNLILICCVLATAVQASAQDTGNAADLIKQGTQLNKQGNYAVAIEKYKEALKTDSNNAQANYQMGFSLQAAGRGNEAIPYAEKAIKGNGSATLTAASYALLGSIYDEDHQTQKAIDTYKEGIKLNPAFQQLHFNLGLAYSRNKQYAEAEIEAIESIKLDPKHASSQRMYALVTFHQNKRLNALLGLCSFILLEPNTPRSAEAYTNIQSILKGGALSGANGRQTIILSPKDKQDIAVKNMVISTTVSVARQKKLAGMDMLEFELKHIFSIAGNMANDDKEKDFFDKFFAAYFLNLAQSDNIAAFTRMVSLSANKEENTKWMMEHDKERSDFDKWIAATERKF